ncbi:MAG: ABC transporter permease [Nitriliruptoraceae bacterium]
MTTTTAPPNASERVIRERITLRDVVIDTAVIARRNLVRVVRLPQLLLFATVQPVMFLVLFNFVFGGAISESLPTVDADHYIVFLLPGLMVQIATFGAGQTALGLIEDLNNGVVDRFRSLPMARSAVLAGRTLADLVRNAAVLSLMLGIAFLLGFRWQTSLWLFLAGFGLGLLFSYALSWIMASIGLSVRNPEAAQTAVMLPMFPFVFASAVFIPTHTMPGWLQAFANNQPITIVANAMRGLMVGEELLPAGQTVGGQVLAALAWILGIIIVFAPLAVRRYRRVVL